MPHRFHTPDTLRLGAATVPAMITIFAEDFALTGQQRELLVAAYRGYRYDEMMLRLGITVVELKAALQGFVLQTGRSVWVAAQELASLRPSGEIPTMVPAFATVDFPRDLRA